MPDLTIALPDSISEAEARVCLAGKLFELGRLSCGKAAEMVGLCKRTFLELLGRQQVAVLDYPPDELMEDLRHA